MIYSKPNTSQQASTLETIYFNLSPEPLKTQEEIDAFYIPEINKVRGGDKIERLQLGLKRIEPGSHYKACLMGHQGVGKSTELTRLVNDSEIKNKYSIIRFSITTDLNPANVAPFDILILIVIEIVEKTKSQTQKEPNNETLNKFLDWFNITQSTKQITKEEKVNIEGGVGVKGDGIWAQISGLFASLKGELRFASIREEKIIEHRLSRLSELVDISNELLDDCNQKLLETTGHQWLIIGEDFDKAGIPTKTLQDLFITYANILTKIKVHLIFNLPIRFYCSLHEVNNIFPFEQSLIIPDTAVFHLNHSPNTEGRNAIKKVLEARVNSDLFEENQIERLIIASGGNLRDLFSLVNYAADTAILKKKTKIDTNDVTNAISNLRTEYQRRLGGNTFEQDTINYTDKAELLERIYNKDPNAQIPDRVLYALLNDRAVQEIWEQDERWFGIHPLVVDILSGQGRVSSSLEGGVPGGTSS